MQSVCGYCGVGCEIEAVVQNNKIKKILPVKNGLSSNGSLCVKGSLGFDFAQSENRLRTNLISYKFIEKNAPNMPFELQVRIATLKEYDDKFYEGSLELITKIAAWKLKEISENYGRKSIMGIGGARTSLENAWLFQKFIRESLNSPNIDNCARVCHSPSLSGLMMSIGEGASSVSFDHIFDSELLFVIGSNTTEAHPIVANRIKKAKKKGIKIVVVDVRETNIMKLADIKVILPFESNLLFLNSIAKEMIENDFVDSEFISTRCKEYEEYKSSIFKTPNDKKLFQELKGYENVSSQIEDIAKLIFHNKTLFLWGLGITEHLDGTNSVNAISNLGLISGNFGKIGTGVLPLRGQNNVQGCCDVGCLPYYAPDYQKPKEIGLMTPDSVDEMINGNIKAVLNMGEDLTHIHSDLNKFHKAIKNLELIMVQELFLSDIAMKADIVFGVKSSYEKYGVYVNAERRLHLSTPIIKNDLPDDWEVIQKIENEISNNFHYESSEEIFEKLCQEVKRYEGANYERLKDKPLQWPIDLNGVDSPLLHKDNFSTPDGYAHFNFREYSRRGMVKSILNNNKKWYLTTGRSLYHYNNSAQTSQTLMLLKKQSEDILLINEIHKDDIKDKIILKSAYGESEKLNVKFTNRVKPYTIYTTFHFAKSKINYLFGAEGDEQVKTTRFKSVEVEVI